jgi:SM-20-related protein
MLNPMNRAASVSKPRTNLPAAFIDMDALRSASVERDPFPFFIVPRFVKAEALDAIRVDFPVIRHAGSFPLSTLEYGPAFAAFMDDIQSPEMTKAVTAKLSMDLSASPTMVTVRGQSRAADGKIHTDSRTKLVTALIYMNDAWESPKGRLRLVRSQTDLNDVIAEVPPDQGTLLVFRNDTNAWHGFEPFAGPRRVIQLNWVTDASVVRREQNRHRVSAFFKRLSGRGM